MKQKSPKKTEILSCDYLKLPKILDNTENTGRENLLLLEQLSSPRCRDDIAQTNKSLINGRSPRSLHSNNNNHSIISLRMPSQNCLEEKKNELEPEEQKCQSQSCKANDQRIMNLEHVNKLNTIISDLEKEKSESLNDFKLDISQIDQLVNHENEPKFDSSFIFNIIKSNVIYLEGFKDSENIQDNEADEENVFHNKFFNAPYYIKSKEKDIDNKLNNVMLNLENIPNNDKKDNGAKEKFEKKDQKNNMPPTNDTIDEIEAKLRIFSHAKSKSTLIPLQLGDIATVCEQESEIEKNKIAEASNKESERSIANACLVCFDKQPDAVIMNCGHGGIIFYIYLDIFTLKGICYDCSLEMWKAKNECYLCRKVIY